MTMGRRILSLCCGLAVLVVVLATFTHQKRPPATLADLTNVERLSARLYNSPVDLPDIDWFDMPAAHIPAVMATLTPAEVDPLPTTYQVLGQLKCVVGTGIIEVDLYWTGDKTAAYGVRWAGARTGTSYRGGTDATIERVIRKAFKERAGRGQ